MIMRGYGTLKTTFYEGVHLVIFSTFANRMSIEVSTVCRTIQTFEQTGYVKDKPNN